MFDIESALTKGNKILVDSDIWIPPGYEGETNIIVPDAVVRYAADYFGLCSTGVNGIDPMVGVGTIPRIINQKGGNCLGVEIDRHKYEISSEVLGDDKMLFGDFTTLAIPPHSFKYVFTSMPFAWFDEISSVDSKYANKFKELMLPWGFLLLDTVTTAIREGTKRPIAKLQTDYFRENGFVLDEVLMFEDENPEKKVDEESVILKFLVA